MNTTIATDEIEMAGEIYSPGQQLSIARKALGITCDQVAEKLHLRTKIIELLEADEYELLPEPVFIKGYMRAFAKILDISPEPIIAAFNLNHVAEDHKIDRTLWQSSRNTHNGEKILKSCTAIFAVIVLISVVMWWHKNKDSETSISEVVSQTSTEVGKIESDIKLTDLSKMRSLLSSDVQYNLLEKKGG